MFYFKGLIINIITEFSTLPETCHYLNDREQRLHYKYIDSCESSYQNILVKRGWRRFGEFFLRPCCANCNECKSIKIDVKNFTFSKSQRRVIRKNRNTKIYIGSPTITLKHIALYNKFHRFQQKKKGWKHRDISIRHYQDSFVDGAGDFGKEVLYFINDKLVGVDLIDMVDDGISSIYFFYDPDYRKYSLGVYSLLTQIKMAKEKNLKWIYLGYYVKDCNSLNYKDKYRPYLTLQNNPDDDEEDIWKEVY